MDVLDPSYAPGVGNPHPEGLSTVQLMDIIEGVMSKKFEGFDITEVYPHYDTGITVITAGYLVMETIYAHLAC
jgi:agmatinase